MLCTRQRKSSTVTRIGATFLLLGCPILSVGAQEEVDYAELADDFVLGHLSDDQMAGRAPDAIHIEEFLELAYLHVDLGVLRVHYPKRGYYDLVGRKKKLKTYRGKPSAIRSAHDFASIARELLELQVRWVEIAGSANPGSVLDVEGADKLLPGYQALSEWLATTLESKPALKTIKEALIQEKRDWSGKAGAKTPQPDLNLVELITDQGSPVRLANETFNEAMRTGAFWEGGSVVEREPISIVLCPTRGDIVGFALYAARDRGESDYSWHSGVWNYTQFHVQGVQAIGFRYSEDGAPDDLHGGNYMSDIDEEGGVVRQHAVQYGTAMLLEYYFGPTGVSSDPATPKEQVNAQRIMGSLLAGGRRFLVTYLYGKNEVRDEGDIASRTNARSIFISGGQSSGGRLGKMSAEASRWRMRSNKEGDFIRDLIGNLDFGKAKAKPAALPTLALKSDGAKKHQAVVLAPPFLARDAQDLLPSSKGPAKEKERDKVKRLRINGGFQRDYVGFLRAYEIAFYEWLSMHMTPSAGEVSDLSAAQAHALLLEQLALVVTKLQEPGERAYDLSPQMKDVVARVYGMPLTWPADGDSSMDSLERDFLLWLAERASQ